MKAERAIVVYGMGITQHRRGRAHVQQLANLCARCAAISAREGAGLCPVRGHSNVQGDRTVGITEIPPADFLERLEHALRLHAALRARPQCRHRAGGDGERRGERLLAMGGNIAAAIPDWQVTQDALRRLDLTVHVSTKLNRSHLMHGRAALILPCLGRTEIDIQASGAAVHHRRGFDVDGPRLGRTQQAGIGASFERGRRSSQASPTRRSASARWSTGTASVADYDRIRDAIEAVFPIFQGYNARIRIPGGCHLHLHRARAHLEDGERQGQRPAA